ncbi:phytoene desaturase family protein [Mesorhizobium retamae]|uniref:Pyridine nucleotide-disulfide oxidoreductase domain-containing protein 2 n=1 Tax=Mesorhizobium retamae TaxID=2912854 RepID=A0ABS9QDA2_9HYPH|nr:NAD(P)/FAD-dependent oxidoreductase [Mesorhizobium sp. IRAMC:0171]
MGKPYDVVIIGAGHNGLVSGAYLAQAGKSVLALERRDVIGGAAVTEELWPGYSINTASYVMSLLQPKIMLDLKLKSHGLEVIEPPPLVQLFPDGRHLTFWGAPERMAAEFAKFCPEDREAYVRYRAHLTVLAPTVRNLMWSVPIDPTSRKPSEMAATLRFLWKNRGAIRNFYDLFDLFTMSAYDYLGRWFKSETAKLALGFYAAGGGGGNASFRTPGTAFALTRSLLRDHSTAAGGPGFVKGGMGSISKAIAAAGGAHGMEVRTGAKVASVIVKDGRAVGVELETGETVSAKVVVANANARTTFLQLVPKTALPAGFVAHIAQYQAKSTVFKVHLALDGLPTVPGFAERSLGFDYPIQLRIAPSVDSIEESYALAQAGRITERPFLTAMTPSVLDPTLAPPGHHVMSIFGGHVPNVPRGSSWDDKREDLYESAIDTLAEYMPDVRQRIVHHQTLTPLDYERVFDLPGGHLQHGEMSLNQMFFSRPAPHFAAHRSPVAGLYICGASAHPGGGVTGIPGHNAASVILKDRAV